MPKASKSDSQLRSEKHQAALDEYEKGVRLLQQKDYKKAIPRFEAIIERYPEEGVLGDRARTYLSIATGKVRERAPLTSTREPELCYEVGLFLLNDGQPKEAVRHLERAAEHAPEDAGVLLTLASARWQAGDKSGCLEALGRGIASDPRTRYRALHMSDFDGLTGDPEFRALVHAEA